jgi:Trp operon repressor
MLNYWTDEEVNTLKNHYCDKTIQELMQLLPTRSEYSIRTKARDLNLKKEDTHFWSDKEIEILKTHYKKSNKELEKFLPGRTANSIQKQKQKQKLKDVKIKKPAIKKSNYFWSDKETEILKNNYHTESTQKILELLPERTLLSIRAKVIELKLTQEKEFWSDEEIKILKENYQNKSIENLMELLPGRSESTIRAKASRLNLTTKLKQWSEEEKEILQKYYKTESIENLVKRLVNRTAKSIVLKANSLSLTKD